MNRNELEALVPLHCEVGRIPYVFLRDIPEPYRSEFTADSAGSTMAYYPGEPISHYAHDWQKWLGFRFAPGYKPRYGPQSC